MFIGERLADLRKDKGLGQKELADILKVKSKTISAYENEITAPSNRVQEEIARCFNVSLDYLHGLVDNEVPFDRSQYIILPKDSPAEMKEELLDYLEYLKGKYNVNK